MKQVTLKDLQSKTKQKEQQQALRTWKATVDPVQSQLMEVLAKSLKIQDGAILQLGCGASVFHQHSPSLLYQGIDVDDTQLKLNQQAFPSAVFTTANILDMAYGEPSKGFAVVIAQPPKEDPYVIPKEGCCLEMAEACAESLRSSSDFHDRRATRIRDVSTELASKTLVDGGVFVLIYSSPVESYYLNYLHSKFRVVTDVTVEDLQTSILIGQVQPKPENEYERITVATVEELRDHLSGIFLSRVCTSTSDPRPITIHPWGITKTKAKPIVGPTTTLVRSGQGVGWRFGSATAALTWAGNVLKLDRENPWFRAVAKIRDQFNVYNYLRLRSSSRPLWDIGLLSPSIQVDEAEDLKRYLKRLQRQLKHDNLSYPINDDVNRLYWSLGPGQKVRRGSESYRVLYSEVDPTDTKPPKITLEKEGADNDP